MFASHPYSEVVGTHIESDLRQQMRAFSTLPPRTLFFVVDLSFSPLVESLRAPSFKHFPYSS